MGSHPEVSALIEDLLGGVRGALGDNLVGAYLGGSLALGGFDPATSDVDVLAVTELPLSEAELGRLGAVHASLPPSYEAPGRDYEVYYIDRATLRRFGLGQRHVKVGPDDPLGWIEHRPNWVIERWVVREHGVTLTGPDPKSLIDPVTPDEMRWAAGEEIRWRLAHWRDGIWPMSEMAHRGAQAFEVETVCRAVHTADAGQAASKRVAVDWALRILPERWHGLIVWSQRHKKERTRDPTRVPEVLEFLAWAVSEADRRAVS
jgi:hypothetical protein